MKDNCIYKIIEYSINKYEITDSIDGLKYPYKDVMSGIEVSELRYLEYIQSIFSPYENSFNVSLKKLDVEYQRQVPYFITNKKLWIDILEKHGLSKSDYSVEANKLRNKKMFFFDFYLPDIGLSFEIDGSQHNNTYSVISDKARDDYLKEEDQIETVRFTNYIWRNDCKIVNDCIQNIRKSRLPYLNFNQYISYYNTYYNNCIYEFGEKELFELISYILDELGGSVTKKQLKDSYTKVYFNDKFDDNIDRNTILFNNLIKRWKNNTPEGEFISKLKTISKFFFNKEIKFNFNGKTNNKPDKGN